MFYCFNQKEGLIPRSLLRNKLMMNEVSLGLIPRSLLRGVSFLRWLWKAKLPFLFGKLKWDELNQEVNNEKEEIENIAP